MARKVKTPTVPLSGLDKFIYVILALLWVAFCIATVVVFGIAIPQALAFSDATVVAREGAWGVVCSLPMAFWGTSPLLIALGHAWKTKQPIFGNKKFKAQFGKPVIKLTPLFSPEFRKNLQADQKKYIKKTLISFVIVFVVCALIIPFGLFPRKVLDTSNQLRHYNCLNQMTDERRIEDAEKLIIYIDYSHGYRTSPKWGIRMTFKFEDSKYSFTLGSFNDMEREDVLRYMLKLKGIFSQDQYEIVNVEDMEDLVIYRHFSDAELKLVYDLFDYTP